MAKHRWATAILITFLLSAFNFVAIQSSVQAESSGDDWPMFHHDPAHTGYSTNSVPTTPPVVLWASPKGLGGSPVVLHDYVYIISQAGISCFNTSNGEQIWNQRLQYGFGAEVAPAVSGGYVYTPMLAYNASTGELVLNYTDSWGGTSPTVANGMIYLGYRYADVDRGGVFALDASTAAVKWNFTAGHVSSSPTVAYDRVYFSSWDGNVYALDALSGAKVWNQRASGLLRDSSPAVVDGHVFIGSSTNVYAFDALTGAKIWSYPTSGSGYSSPAVANGYVYVGSLDANIYALNASTGEQIWNATVGGSSSPSVADGVVYTGDSYKILAFNATTGSKIWSYTFPETEDYVPSSPAIVDGVVYAGGGQAIYAFGASAPTQHSLSQGPFPSIWVAVAIVVSVVAVVGVGLLIYFKKRKRTQL